MFLLEFLSQKCLLCIFNNYSRRIGDRQYNDIHWHVRDGQKNLKFSTGPGWVKKSEIFDRSGPGKSEIFDSSRMGKKNLKEKSGVVDVNILALFTDTEVNNCLSTYHN